MFIAAGNTYWSCFQAFSTGTTSVDYDCSPRTSASSTTITYTPSVVTLLQNGITVASLSNGIPDDTQDMTVMAWISTPYGGNLSFTMDRITVVRTTSPEPVASVGPVQ